MKRLVLISSLLVALAAAACTHPEFAMPQLRPEPVEGQHKLAAIDTLIQSQPDSALSAILPIFESDTIATYDRHYADLLLSEALFKCDYEQTTRPALLEAMAYFDSLAAAQPKSEDFFLLSARAHYMNGVGLVEADSVVEACAEYLHTLQMMEIRFCDDELIATKGKLSALLCTRLTELYSDQYLPEQAIFFGKRSLIYYDKYGETPQHIAWATNEIATQFDMLRQWETAQFYYEKTLSILTDTNHHIYRDAKTHLAFLSYETTNEAENSVDIVKQLATIAQNEKEFVSRCLTIGEIYYHEKQYDSANVYLGIAYEKTDDIGIKKQSAEWLVEVRESLKDTLKIAEYSRFLVQFATEKENKSTENSALSELYNSYKQSVLENKHDIELKSRMGRLNIIIIGVVVVAFLFLLLYLFNHKQKNLLQDELSIKETQHSATMGKMKSVVENLKNKNKLLLEKGIESKQKINSITETQTTVSDYKSFLREGICVNIKQKLKTQDILTTTKLEAYSNLALSQKDLLELTQAVDRHCPHFGDRIKKNYPAITDKDLQLCRLYILDLSIIQVAVLLDTDYSSIRRRTCRIKEKMNNCTMLSEQLKSLFFDIK